MSTEGQSGQHQELEREAVALWKQYGFFLPGQVKGFLRKLAAFLNWKELQGAMG
ncbi:hypothetical protein [Noviherbaspirillum sp. Root189]|uniref:hypothetical protein n=1 Tax=Noviherbaspirillum sp. Root189 TaxID=1736487 RepID=UPI0012E33DEE|nr:hypothetical protein [Noviherbaspirillum sp. Root189]